MKIIHPSGQTYAQSLILFHRHIIIINVYKSLSLIFIKSSSAMSLQIITDDPILHKSEHLHDWFLTQSLVHGCRYIRIHVYTEVINCAPNFLQFLLLIRNSHLYFLMPNYSATEKVQHLFQLATIELQPLSKTAICELP